MSKYTLNTKKIIRRRFILIIYCLLSLSVIGIQSCSHTGKTSFNPSKKYSVGALRADYMLFRTILEQNHPSLYWYTSKDSMDYFFNKGYSLITDSMTELQFRTSLSYVISKINCGHTTTRNSKAYTRYLSKSKLPIFPLALKFTGDSVAITANANKKDSILKKGIVITSINDIPINTIRDSLCQYLASDGYNQTYKRQALSNSFSFGPLYNSVYRQKGPFKITYIDGIGMEKSIQIPLYTYTKDSTGSKVTAVKQPAISKKEKKEKALLEARSFRIDTASSTGYMDLTTFSQNKKLKPFFKQTFYQLDNLDIKNLVIDLRANFGGTTSNMQLLTGYLINRSFHIGDSIYAIRKHNTYNKLRNQRFVDWMLMTFVAKKMSDGAYHMSIFEKNYTAPAKQHHFFGNIYLLTGGNTFSAAALFAGNLKGQQNVHIIGEETGGGQRGTTAFYIPDYTLPNTKVRFRAPKFRIIANTTIPKGHGVMPDIEVHNSIEDIRVGIDSKMLQVKQMIQKETTKK